MVGPKGLGGDEINAGTLKVVRTHPPRCPAWAGLLKEQWKPRTNRNTCFPINLQRLDICISVILEFWRPAALPYVFRTTWVSKSLPSMLPKLQHAHESPESLVKAQILISRSGVGPQVLYYKLWRTMLCVGFFICLGCSNRRPWTGQLLNIDLGLGKSKVKVPADSVSERVLLLVPSYCVLLTWWKGWGSSRRSLL